MTDENRTVRLKVSPEVARVVGPGAPREARLQAARGALPLSPEDTVAALFFLAHGGDAEIRAAAVKTVRSLDGDRIVPVAGRSELHPRLLDFLARVRLRDPAVMAALLANPALPEPTLLQVAGHARGPVLELLAEGAEEKGGSAALVAALLKNPDLPGPLRQRLEQTEDADGQEGTEEGEEEAEEATEEDQEGLSKYQLALEMKVSEKIKMAITGDKEWRGIFLKDSNKLVSAAVLKNPRITDGEVLMVAKNKSSSEELIRLITLNREWVKNLEIQKALIYHPKTPLPKALRYMNTLTEKDLKHLAKSRGVSQVLVNNARRMLTAKKSSR